MRLLSSLPTLLVAAALLVPAFAARAADAKADQWMYVGTYTGPKSKGIYLFRFNADTGEAKPMGVAAELASPSFLAIHPSGKFLYAVSEVDQFDGKKAGFVSGYAIDRATGKLTSLNRQTTGGPGPCHVNITPNGKWLLVANYAGGSVEVLPIGADGKIGSPSAFDQHQGSSVNPQRQEAAHAHSIHADAAGRYVFVPDLGMDKIVIYQFDDQNGKLAPGTSALIKPGSGPRHFDFHPGRKFAYVINEMASTVTGFTYDSQRGVLTEIQTISTLPEDFKGESTCADVHVHPSGKFLYGSNRGHDSIAVFTIDPTTGKLTAAGQVSTQGKTPRNFAIDPSGKFLIAENQNSDSLVFFKIDPATGALQPTGLKIDTPAPVCIKFVAAEAK